HNVGSIFRTADAVGVEKIYPDTKRALAPKAQRNASSARYSVGVYLCGITPSPLDTFGKVRPQFAKVALGAEKYVSWEKVKSTTKLIDNLKAQRFKILAVEQSKRSIPYHKVKVRPKEKIALVLGAEVKGLSPSILKKADKILEIPMAGAMVRQGVRLRLTRSPHHPRRTRRGKESLNVAVAFGIVAFGIMKADDNRKSFG
ncbi:MAG: TrmH family RNA methyltransferase, partial [Candidatus Colwellbacteria bacterium]